MGQTKAMADFVCGSRLRFSTLIPPGGAMSGLHATSGILRPLRQDAEKGIVVVRQVFRELDIAQQLIHPASIARFNVVS
jgi:hypothetical protein